DKLLHGHRGWISRSEACALHKTRHEVLLVSFQCLLPTALAHDDALANLLSIGQKLAESYGYGRAGQIAVSSFVGAVNQITCLLKFNREEKGSRRIDTVTCSRRRVTARVDVVCPEVPTRRVGLTNQEI